MTNKSYVFTASEARKLTNQANNEDAENAAEREIPIILEKIKECAKNGDSEYMAGVHSGDFWYYGLRDKSPAWLLCCELLKSPPYNFTVEIQQIYIGHGLTEDLPSDVTVIKW